MQILPIGDPIAQETMIRSRTGTLRCNRITGGLRCPLSSVSQTKVGAAPGIQHLRRDGVDRLGSAQRHGGCRNRYDHRTGRRETVSVSCEPDTAFRAQRNARANRAVALG